MMNKNSEQSQQIIKDLKEFLKAQREAGEEWLSLPKQFLGPTILSVLRDSLKDCKRCRLSSSRTRVVFGEGDPSARLFFIGEAPGAEEDRTGRPFIGRAGELLTKIIESIKLSRDQVYISSVIKCRPPGNRNPEQDEINTCKPFLLQQIQAIRPSIICTLGSVATNTILGNNEPISKNRGEFHHFHGIYVMPTFHPAYLLRNQRDKKLVWEDMKKIQALYQKLGLFDKDHDSRQF